MQESENQRERGEGNDIQPATVGINVPVRPETPSGSAVVPVVTGNEEHDSGLCRHNMAATCLHMIYTQSVKKNTLIHYNTITL